MCLQQDAGGMVKDSDSHPRTPTDERQASSCSFGDAVLTALWDYAVPMLTWLYMFLFTVVPGRHRWLIITAWLLPVLAGTRLHGSQRWLRTLQRIAKLKQLHVNKTCAEMPSQCVFGFHPHGSFPMGLLPWMASRPDVFADTVLAQSSTGSWFPTIGYVTMFSNVMNASRRDISKALMQGQQVALLPGGLKEGVACRTFSREIPLVKHDGFLRLARSTALERRQQGQEYPSVVPCFLFGMHDWYSNVLPGVSRFLYAKTGMLTLPLWWLSKAGDKASKVMVVGEPLDPLMYETEEELADAYYTRVVELFEMHKGQVPGYEHRYITCIASQKPEKKATTTSKPKSHVAGLVYVMVSTVFLAIVAAHWLATGSTLRLSYATTYPQTLSSSARCHWIAGLLWTGSVCLNVVMPRQRFHKHVGRVGGLAFIWLCVSACQMIEKGIHLAQLQGDFWESMHCAIHSLANLQAMGFGCWLLGYGIAAAVVKEMEVHRKQMVSLCGFLVLSFLPRVFAAWFRWALPFVSKEGSYTLALVITFLVAAKVIMTWKKARCWAALNMFVLAISSCLLLAFWQHYLSSRAAWAIPNMFVMLGVYGKRLRVLEDGSRGAGKNSPLTCKNDTTTDETMKHTMNHAASAEPAQSCDAQSTKVEKIMLIADHAANEDIVELARSSPKQAPSTDEKWRLIAPHDSMLELAQSSKCNQVRPRLLGRMSPMHKRGNIAF